MIKSSKIKLFKKNLLKQKNDTNEMNEKKRK
jgi:hypothetical protein